VSTVVGVVVGIVGLGFLILVHELGHYIVAKATKMRVEEFSIGFGPYLVKKRWGETVYGISAFPLGGYVRVTGMHEEEFERRVTDLREQEAQEASQLAAAAPSGAGDAGEGRRKTRRRPQDPEDRLAGKRALSAEEIASTPLERRYYAHPLWHRLLFIVAGVLMNMLAAVVFLYAVGVVEGENWRTTEIGGVTEGGGAATAGIEEGDRIVSLAGEEIDRWNQLQVEILKHKGESIQVVVERDGEVVTFPEVEVRVGEDGLGQLGVRSTTEIGHRDIGPLEGVAFAGRETGNMVVLIFEGIGMMFSRDVPLTGSQGVAGALGIVQISAEVVKSGLTSYLWFLALISVNFALLNMLPLLPLDGGHFILNIAERLRGRSISLRTFERISMFGFALFGVLFFVAMYNDIVRIADW